MILLLRILTPLALALGFGFGVLWAVRGGGGMTRIILDLCGGTGSWSKPYRDAGYDVRLVTLLEQDVRTYLPPANVHGILAAPPCTEFAVSGARWWAGKDPALLDEAVEIARACLGIVAIANPRWWAIENPIGRIREMVPELGPPLLTFDPCDYGDGYTKRTQVFGHFRPPFKLALVAAPDRTYIHHQPPGPRRQEVRSATPPGFAAAFFKANP